MKRIALIGENSIQYIYKLISIWNNGDCAVLIDWRIPFNTACKLMIEANVSCCHIEDSYFDKCAISKCANIQFDVYRCDTSSAALLPNEVYTLFCPNYSQGEALVIYSSGTTGKSKGVILSHYAINKNADAIQDYMKLSSSVDVLYIAKSLSHSSTLIGELLVGLKYKIPMVIAPTIVPPRYVLNNIGKFSVTTIALNPTLVAMYAEEITRKKYNLHFLKTIYVSGSILDDAIYNVIHSTFKDIAIYNVYGLTEAGPRVTAQRKYCCKTNSVGIPIKDVELMIVNDLGDIVDRGVKGIIHVKTECRYIGYISGQERVASLYKDWLNTCDIGYIDDAGELHITDRVDDLIIIDAHKVFPSDIENTIRSQFKVDDCLVYKKNSKYGDYLECLYVSDNDILDAKERLQKILLPYEIPRVFYRVHEILKNANGKKIRQH